MKKILTTAICLLRSESTTKAAEERQARMEQEAREYYANADTALYGVRYRFFYLYNKSRNLRYEEDRMVLVRPEVTLDMSYEGLGESRWMAANKGIPSHTRLLFPLSRIGTHCENLPYDRRGISAR